VERIMRFAFAVNLAAQAADGGDQKATPSATLLAMWDEIAAQMRAEFADVTWDKELWTPAHRPHINRPPRWTRWWSPTRAVDILERLRPQHWPAA
jgi:tartrate dehydrogenase/decarboxylase/D-malate dehydrogenase